MQLEKKVSQTIVLGRIRKYGINPLPDGQLPQIVFVKWVLRKKIGFQIRLQNSRQTKCKRNVFIELFRVFIEFLWVFLKNVSQNALRI